MGYMKVFVFALVVELVYTQSMPCGIPSVQTGRVIGGSDAKHGAWPWQILLQENNIAMCGGSIVGPSIIITAAHCIVDQRTGRAKHAYSLTVKVGDNNRLRYDQGEKTYRVARIIAHPDFSFRTFKSDVAILELQSPIAFNNYVKPVCMPKFRPAANTNCFISGWGRPERHAHQMSNQLKQAMMPVVDPLICQQDMRRVAPFVIGAYSICAGRGDGNQSGCQGDSGGPFVCVNKARGRFELHGAVSWGSRECSKNPREYTVYANIENLSGWIRGKVGNNNLSD